MITYLVTQKHAYTIRTFISLWGKRHCPAIKVRSYESLLQADRLCLGPYIFSDIERLSSSQAGELARMWERLSTNNDRDHRLLNHPLTSMRRYQLVRTLYERGINSYNLYRLDEDRQKLRFPVFLRNENDHGGSISPLLQTHEDLEKALRSISPSETCHNGLVVVEFCDTSDANNVFRKYSAYMVDGRIIPQHIMFGKHWLVKPVTNLACTIAEVLEEKEYVFNNPHEKELRAVFSLAGIQYGRVDYALLDGKIQIWEINTNPTIIGIGAGSPDRRDVRLHFLKQLTSAFDALEGTQECAARSIPIKGSSMGVNQTMKRWAVYLTDGYYIFKQAVARVVDRIRYGKDKDLHE